MILVCPDRVRESNSCGFLERCAETRHFAQMEVREALPSSSLIQHFARYKAQRGVLFDGSPRHPIVPNNPTNPNKTQQNATTQHTSTTPPTPSPLPFYITVLGLAIDSAVSPWYSFLVTAPNGAQRVTDAEAAVEQGHCC